MIKFVCLNWPHIHAKFLSELSILREIEESLKREHSLGRMLSSDQKNKGQSIKGAFRDESSRVRPACFDHRVQIRDHFFPSILSGSGPTVVSVNIGQNWTGHWLPEISTWPCTNENRSRGPVSEF